MFTQSGQEIQRKTKSWNVKHFSTSNDIPCKINISLKTPTRDHVCIYIDTDLDLYTKLSSQSNQ